MIRPLKPIASAFLSRAVSRIFAAGTIAGGNNAKAAGQAGRCRPAIFNAANEECVAAFTAGALPFLGIVETVERTLQDAPDFGEPGTVEDVLAAESWARAYAREHIAAAATAVEKGA